MEVTATKIFNRLEWSDLILILALLTGARLVSGAARWLIRRLAETAPGRWRLPIPQIMPIARLVIVFAVVVKGKPWGTHHRVKAYVRESRDQVSITSDLTVRGKAALLRMGIEAARVPMAEAGA